MFPLFIMRIIKNYRKISVIVDIRNATFDEILDSIKICYGIE